MVTNVASARAWTLAGLTIALAGTPIVAWAYRLAVGETTAASQILVRELVIFGLLAALLWIIIRKERLPLHSIGLKTNRIGLSLLWRVIGMLACGVGVAVSLGLNQLLGLQFGEGPRSFVTPLGATLIVILRAGIVEESFYRGYAIERLTALTGSRSIAVALPLVVFALFHYRQGAGGILAAFILGAILSGLYVWKRDLIANIVAHFLIDFIPNVLLPLID